MKKLFALIQILGALMLTGLAAMTVGNMVMMVSMNDTISVVHLLIGQTVLIACLLAIARYLIRRGLAGLRNGND